MARLAKALKAEIAAMICAPVICGLAVEAGPARSQNAAFVVPAGEATASLAAWAALAGVKIAAPASLLAGVTTQPVKGSMDAREALAAMIAGTGLRIMTDDGSTIALGLAANPVDVVVPWARADAVFDLRIPPPYAFDGVSYWQVAEPWGDQDAVITIDSRSFTYSATCGASEAPYRQSGAELSISVLDAGPAGCADRAPFQRYAAALRQATGVRGVGDRLYLEGGGVLMNLTRFDPPGLQYRRWTIAQVRWGGALVTARGSAGSNPPQLVFDRGQIGGSPGCGRLAGAYAIGGEELILTGPNWAPGAVCAPGQNDQGRAVASALSKVRRFQIDGRRMLLKGRAGEAELVLSR
ncbi:MAG: TonB-dependent receptor [Caulobacteraceae bacterium]|nr:TonB-dependent receptor [Caulobacteraceae bacterium]